MQAKPVPEHPGLFIDEHGVPWRGGQQVRPRVGRGGNKYLAHGGRIVWVGPASCAAWHGPAPAGHTIRYLNGKVSDTRPENLAWRPAGERTQRRG